MASLAQSLHALKVLRYHGVNDDALKVVYKSVVLANLAYCMRLLQCMVGVHDIVQQRANISDRATRCSTQSIRS